MMLAQRLTPLERLAQRLTLLERLAQHRTALEREGIRRPKGPICGGLFTLIPGWPGRF